MRYDHTISFITPIAYVETARAVSRAFDPDVGGADAFQMMLSADGALPATHAAYSTPCSSEFLSFLELPVEQIHAMIVADYQARWSEIEPPTHDEVYDFMLTLIDVPDVNLMQVIEDNSLKIIIPNSVDSL